MDMKNFPILSVRYQASPSRWMLTRQMTEVSLELVINHDWSGEPDRYEFQVYQDGGHTVVKTQEEFESWRESFIENEGEEAWEKYRNDEHDGQELNERLAKALYGFDVMPYFQEMITHWELMNKLVRFSVNM